jgi:hypothetical protein|tara:strand:+ start:41882 stop:42496 length:615 start_codon:yes stop_codon:yes gene_type:complete
MITPPRTVFINTMKVRVKEDSGLIAPPEDNINSKTNTARRAPIGSITMPSHLRILEIVAFGRTVLSIGITTVGPVTTAIAPKSNDSSQEKSRMNLVLTAIIIQVTKIPDVTRFLTTFSSPLIWSKRKVRAPSNRITATDSEMKGKRKDPMSASGSSNPVIGPRHIPDINSGNIAGSFAHHAAHWHAPITVPRRANSSIKCSLIL